MIQRIKGTQDWLDLTLFNFFIEQAVSHLTGYNFTQIKTPVLEPTELFKRSLGVATDVVGKEMFIIKSVHNDDAICLRPEATASTVRAFLENGIQELPWKVFSWGPMFRYERPQKGRFREFHQITIENIGAASVGNDVRLIAMLDRFFYEKLKLDSYALLINYLGSYEDRARYKTILKEFLSGDKATEICDTCKERRESNTLRVFDCKNPVCQKVYEQAPYMIDHLSAESLHEWQELKLKLELLSVSYTVDPRLVRGLDYYNKTVFEFVSNDLGAQNTFCGGGRYDALAQELGSKQAVPSLGAAMGIERILLLLQERKESLPLPQAPKLTVIVPMSEGQKTLALLVADELHAQNLCVDVLLDGGSMKSLMRKANKMGAAYTVIIGEDEQAAHEVMLKNMIAGTEERIKQTALVEALQR